MTPFLIVAQADTLELDGSAARQQGSPDSNITRCNKRNEHTHAPVHRRVYVGGKLIGCDFDVPKSYFECPT